MTFYGTSVHQLAVSANRRSPVHQLSRTINKKMAHDKPETIAHVSITQQCWQVGNIKGEVKAAEYTWQFQWRFRYKQLLIKPSLGKALIQEPLGRFLESCDYRLEPGSNYTFTIRAKI